MARDYNLLGPDGARARATGLAAAQWYHSDIPRKDMKALMKREDDLPAPNPSIWHAYREVLPILLRQLRYENHFLVRALPPTARPYRMDLYASALGEGAAPFAAAAE